MESSLWAKPAKFSSKVQKINKRSDIVNDTSWFLSPRRHKETQNNLVPLSLSGKGEIVKIRIMAVMKEGATAEGIKI